MDKSWIDLRERTSPTYIEGVNKFLDFAYVNQTDDAKIYCPCKKCKNHFLEDRHVVKQYIITKDFLTIYKIWTYRGETYYSTRSNQDCGSRDFFDTEDDMVGMIQEAIGILMSNDNIKFNHLMENEGHEGSNQEIKDFFRLLEDAEYPLYPNCMKFTSL